jgi:hypothetical protein
MNAHHADAALAVAVLDQRHVKASTGKCAGTIAPSN